MLLPHALRAASARVKLSFDRFIGTAALNTPITLPTDLPTNGIMIYKTFGAYFGGGGAISPPTGWTEIDQYRTVGGGHRQYFYKSIQASDNGVTLPRQAQSLGGGGNNTVLILSADRTITSTSLESLAASVTGGSPGSQTITSSQGAVSFCAIALFGSFNSYTPDAPVSMTQDTTFAPRSAWAYQIFNPGDTLVDLTVSKTDTGDYNELTSFYIEVA